MCTGVSTGSWSNAFRRVRFFLLNVARLLLICFSAKGMAKVRVIFLSVEILVDWCCGKLEVRLGGTLAYLGLWILL